MSAYENIMNTEENNKNNVKQKSKRVKTPPRNKKIISANYAKFKYKLGKVLFNLITMILAFFVIGYSGILIGKVSNLIMMSFYQYYVVFLGLFLFISFKIS